MSKGLEQRAVEWLARLDAPTAAESDRAAFDRWCTEDPKHRAAYLRARATWQRLDRLQVLQPPQTRTPDPDLLQPHAAEARLSRRRFALAASVLFAMLAGGVWFWQRHGVLETGSYATSIGGFERVKLNDGSVIELNTDTEIHVRLQSQRRSVSLLRGEAHFDVAADPDRPFSVTVHNMTIRALGTAFSIRMRDADAVEVLVTEGKVAVDRPDVQAATALAAGQAAIANRTGTAVRRLSVEESKRSLAWQNGMLSFDGTPLNEAVEEINRYNTRHLVLADPALAELRVGGYFKATDPDALARAFEESFGVQAVPTTRGIELKR